MRLLVIVLYAGSLEALHHDSKSSSSMPHENLQKSERSRPHPRSLVALENSAKATSSRLHPRSLAALENSATGKSSRPRPRSLVALENSAKGENSRPHPRSLEALQHDSKSASSVPIENFVLKYSRPKRSVSQSKKTAPVANQSLEKTTSVADQSLEKTTNEIQLGDNSNKDIILATCKNTTFNNILLRRADTKTEAFLRKPGHNGIQIRDPFTGKVCWAKWDNKVTMSLREGGVTTDNIPSTNRQRQMARLILQHFSTSGATSLTQLAARWDEENFNIWNMQSDGPFHDSLNSLKGYVGTEYFGDDVPVGETRKFNGQLVRNEDAQRPSFENNTLDLVLSTEVFEHIPFPYLAHTKILEKLKPGGIHVFTVPFNAGSISDQVLAIQDSEGHINYIGPKTVHADPMRPEGVLVYTIFGGEMVSKLCKLGYEVTAHEMYRLGEGIVGNSNHGDGAVSFVVQKPFKVKPRTA